MTAHRKILKNTDEVLNGLDELRVEMEEIGAAFPSLKKCNPQSSKAKMSKTEELMRRLKHQLKFDVVDELVRLYHDPETKNSDRKAILLALMAYQYPALKAVDEGGSSGETISVTIVTPDQHKEIKADRKNAESEYDTALA